MAEECEIIEAKKPEFEPRSLLRVPHKQGVLVVAYPAFGPDYFNDNVTQIQKHYSHPHTGNKITFRQATTSESISAVAYKFGEMAKPQIFNPRLFQAGRIVRTQEGFFANPPKDEWGDYITDEKTLKSLLNQAKPIQVERGQIYVISNAENLRDFGFAPCETFMPGVQDSREFAESGLARVLEHTEQPARNLSEIASAKFYSRGVNVFGFDDFEEPEFALRVVCLYSSRYSDCDSLVVSDDLDDDYSSGYAFGVLD